VHQTATKIKPGRNGVHTGPLIQRILERLRAVTKTRNGWDALCPGHGDEHPSLGISEGDDGTVLLKCRSNGCTAKSIVEAIGLTMGDLFPANRNGHKPKPKGKAKDRGPGKFICDYIYHNEDGTPNRLVKRFEYSDATKRFPQYRPDGSGGWLSGVEGITCVPYRLPELLAAPLGTIIYIAEGEKDVLNLIKLGLAATTNPQGAKNWKLLDPDIVRRTFRDQHAVLFPDNDAKGRQHGQQVANSLYGIAASIKIVELPGLSEKGDVTDWIDAGGTVETLKALVEAAPEWQPTVGDASESATTTVADDKPRAVVLRASDIEPLKVEWLWANRIPLRALTVIDGDPGEGKSTLTVDITARATCGWAMPPEAGGVALVEPVNVVLLNGEDDPARTIRPRLAAAGADLTRVHILDCIKIGDTERPPTMPADLDIIEQVVRETAAKLLVIDPAMAYVDSSVDAHKDADIRRLLHALKRLAERTGAAVVLIRHLNKLQGGAAIYRGGGSIGINGAARSVFLIGHDQKNADHRILAPVKTNLCARPKSLVFVHEQDGDVNRLGWIGESDLTADEVISQPGGTRSSEVEQCADSIRDMLTGRSLESAELTKGLEAAGYSKATIKRARQKAKLRTDRVGFGKDGAWILSMPTPRNDHRGS
jgi:hypothetical protein